MAEEWGLRELLYAAGIAAIPLAILYATDRGAFRGALGAAVGCAIGYASAVGWFPPAGFAVAVVVIVVSLAGAADGWWDPPAAEGGEPR